MHSKFNGVFNLQKKYSSNIYSKTSISLFSSSAIRSDIQITKPFDKGTSEIISSKLNPYFVTGFTDGEGCFFVGISPNPKYKTGFRVKAIFQIGVHIKDFALLEQIKFFFGVGQITNLGEEAVQYRVSALEDLKVIINHFDEFSLLTYKQSDYLLFKEVVKLIEHGKHLTLEGLNRIVSIKASLNSEEISSKLKLTFPNLIPVIKPECKNRKIKNLH
jgi:hypothetical protein